MKAETQGREIRQLPQDRGRERSRSVSKNKRGRTARPTSSQIGMPGGETGTKYWEGRSRTLLACIRETRREKLKLKKRGSDLPYANDDGIVVPYLFTPPRCFEGNKFLYLHCPLCESQSVKTLEIVQGSIVSAIVKARPTSRLRLPSPEA